MDVSGQFARIVRNSSPVQSSTGAIIKRASRLAARIFACSCSKLSDTSTLPFNVFELMTLHMSFALGRQSRTSNIDGLANTDMLKRSLLQGPHFQPKNRLNRFE